MGRASLPFVVVSVSMHMTCRLQEQGLIAMAASRHDAKYYGGQFSQVITSPDGILEGFKGITLEAILCSETLSVLSNEIEERSSSFPRISRLSRQCTD